MADERFITGKITDEDIEKMRMLIGYPNPTVPRSSAVPHYSVVTADAIRHYTNAYGDDNPLFCDPSYGPRTRWSSQIAPPTFAGTATWDRSLKPSDELRRRTRGALRGVHLFASGGETFYYRPVQPGDRLEGRNSLIAIEEKERSTFSGGRSAVSHNGGVTVNDRGEVISFGSGYYYHTEREGSAERAKERTIELGHYTDDDLAEIDDAYENEFVRGSDTLYYEDATVGEELPTMVKGPLRVTDILGMHIGWGWGNYLVGPLKLDYQNRKRMPGFYGKNEWGAWDCMQRLHWDPLFAQAIGNPTTYDYGNMRACWVAHYLTNYAGDDGWVYRTSNDLRKFNFVGDVTWITGRITGKSIDDELGPSIEIEIEGTNQRAEQSISASSTVLLASRVTGPVKLPPVPDHVRDMAPEPSDSDGS
jgi:acyl dehydratase